MISHSFERGGGNLTLNFWEKVIYLHRHTGPLHSITPPQLFHSSQQFIWENQGKLYVVRRIGGGMWGVLFSGGIGWGNRLLANLSLIYSEFWGQGRHDIIILIMVINTRVQWYVWCSHKVSIRNLLWLLQKSPCFSNGGNKYFHGPNILASSP